MSPVIIGPCMLWRGDCLDILPGLSTDLSVLTDPPYGWTYPGCAGPSTDPTPFLGFPEAILWAGEPGHEPEGWSALRCGPWHAWQKGGDKLYLPFGGQVEWRVHPHEKPLWLMDFCIGQFVGETILDPYMGSGTTGVAAVLAGRKFVGIEINEAYFDIACKRIAAACG